MIVYDPGEIINGVYNKYRIIEHIGSSGQSIFYKAQDLNKTTNFVFLKFYYSLDVEYLHAFYSNIVSKIDPKKLHYFCFPLERENGELSIDIKDDCSFAAFPWINGKTLKEILENEGSLDEKRKRSIVLNLLSAGTALEKANIAHLDLKPDNIFILNDTFVKIIDLDSAWIGEDNGQFCGIRPLAGTPCYRSPEQYERKVGEITTKSDVFNMGIILSQFFIGYPYSGDNEESILHGPPHIESNYLHPELVEAIRDSLIPNPFKRIKMRELSYSFNKYKGTFFRLLKCGVMMGKMDIEYPYYFWETTAPTGQELRGLIRNLPRNPCFSLELNKIDGIYSFKVLSDYLEIKSKNRILKVGDEIFLWLADKNIRPNFTIDGERMYIYLVEEKCDENI